MDVGRESERSHIMFERILVPLDGTEHAERAVPVAARIAHAIHGTLMVMSVVLPPVAFGTYEVSRTVELHPTASQARQERASDYLDEVLQHHAPELEGVKTEKIVAAGAASPTIFEEAHLHHADLIVLCSRGESGLKSWIFGSVARQAVRHSPVPVLVLNEHGNFPPFSLQEHRLRVLVPLDGSPLSETALEPTLQLMAVLAGSTQTSLHLLEVVSLPSPSGRARAFSHIDAMIKEEEVKKAEGCLHDEMSCLLARVPTRLNLTMRYSVVTDTDVAKAIQAEAESAEEVQGVPPYDLIALTTHGWGELQRLVLGSVTERLLGTTRLPLLVVRPRNQAVREEKQKQRGEVSSGKNTKEC